MMRRAHPWHRLDAAHITYPARRKRQGWQIYAAVGAWALIGLTGACMARCEQAAPAARAIVQSTDEEAAAFEAAFSVCVQDFRALHHLTRKVSDLPQQRCDLIMRGKATM